MKALVSGRLSVISKMFSCSLLSALLFAPPVKAQQVKNLPRIGYLASDSRAPTREAFRQGLRDFGYIEGKTILIEWRFAEDKLDRTPELAAELVHLNLDVIVAGNAVAAKSLKRATTTIPIVIAMYAGDPVADGLITSFAKPGGNVTGVIPLSPELSGKRLEFSRRQFPKCPEWLSCGILILREHGPSGKRHKLLPNSLESNFCLLRFEAQMRWTRQLKKLREDEQTVFSC